MKIYIYGLYEEGKEDKIRYIGKTNKLDLQKRLREHICESFRNNKKTHKKHWIKSVLNNNKKINIKCLEETDELNWENKEKYWISKTFNLTNSTKGGECGRETIYTLSYDDCKKYIKEEFNIKSISEWHKSKLPIFIPKEPRNVYLNRGWISWGDFLGTNKVQDNEKAKNYFSYDKAKEYVKNLEIKTLIEWKEKTKKELIPYFIPNRPERFYKNRGWISWGDFLGTNRIANQNKKDFFISYDNCCKFVKENNIKSIIQWRKLVSTFPYNIPKDPHNQYKNKGWISWGEFFGTGYIQDNLLAKNYLSYVESKNWIKNNLPNIKSEKMWKLSVKNNEIPINIPNHPEIFFSKKNRGWIGWKDFLNKFILD